MAQWLECDTLQLPQPAVWVHVMFLPFERWDIFSMFVSLGKASLDSDINEYGCRTVKSTWSWNDTQMNRSSDQHIHLYKRD